MARSTRWKDIERTKCRELGGERSGPLGRDVPDCSGIEVGLEVKRKKKFTWLTEDWRQAKENAAKLEQPPVLAVKEHGRGRDMVQMHSAYWVMLEIGAAIRHERAQNFRVEPTRHTVDSDEVIRMAWDDFVALYRDYYNKEA